MLRGEVDQRAPRLHGIGGAGRVIRINHHQRTRSRRDQTVEYGRHPAASQLLEGPVKHGPRADLCEHRGVKRVGRNGNQDLVTGPCERRQRQLDPFGCARRDDHPVGMHRHAAADAFRRHRFARLEDPRRWRVAVVAIAHRALDGVDHVLGGAEAKEDGIANIEVANLPSRGLDLPRLRNNVANGIAEATHAFGDRNRGRHSRHHLWIVAPSAMRLRSKDEAGLLRSNSVIRCGAQVPP